MPRTMIQAPDDVLELLRQTVELYRNELLEAGVTWNVVMVHAATDQNGEPRGPALKHHGHDALAVVKINSLEDRVKGLADVTLRLDGDRWPEHSRETQVAILHHEAEHLILVRGDDGAVRTDDANRPKLRIRQHDLEIGGFECVVECHKMAAIEAQQYRDLNRRLSQKTLPWG